jgi:hypothetical protein
MKIIPMIQRADLIDKKTPSLKLPKAILSTNQATGNRQQATGIIHIF